MSVEKWVKGILLATLFAVSGLSAQVQCSGKTVNIKPPSDWTTLWYVAGGKWVQVPATAKQAEGWWVFNMTGGQGATFKFGNIEGYYPQIWIGKNKTAMLGGFGLVNQDVDEFDCAEFAAGDAIYIYEDPENPGRTMYGTEPPNALYFNFLPPDDPEWFQGIAQIVTANGRVNMEMDPDRCGWFRMVFFRDPPPESMIIGVDVEIGNPDFEIGVNGLDDDVAVPINLAEKFAALGNTVYFNAEEGALGWTATDPGEERQCSYNLAAFIYDTDAELHGAFSCHANGGGTSCPTAKTWPAGQTPCVGLTKGMVMPDLGPDKKPVYNPASGCFQSAEAFNQLFTPTPGVNHPYCYDLPFARASDGLWEFDSDNNPKGNKGFYPVETELTAEDLVATNPDIAALYAGHASVKAIAATKRMAEGSVAVKGDYLILNPVTGVPYIDTYVEDNGYKLGMFGEGENPEVWDWGDRDQLDGKENSLRNQHFCFRSEADFVYRPGQRFFFRGDDDIWVFINNKLVVDIGGTHLAAPGAVFLDTMGLTPGAEYPINIFFCDRRTTMSNVRIKTNMYFEQKNSIFFAPSPTNPNRQEINGLSSGGGSCAALEQSTDTIKGEKMNLSYWLLSARGDTIHPTGGKMPLATGQTYYGGITIGDGWFEFIENKIGGLAPGRYRLVIYNNETRDKAQRVFRIAGNLGFWSVAGKTGDANLKAKPAAKAMVGSLIPFEVANKADDMIDTEEEATFQLIIPPGLSVYYDSTKTERITGETMIETVGGLRKLWATGTTAAPTDSTYGVMIRGNRDTLFLQYYLPAIAFVDSASFDKESFIVSDILLDPKPQLGDGFSAVFYPTWLVAYDPQNGNLCHICNDIITIQTTDNLEFRSGDGEIDLKLTNGRLNLMVKGNGRIVDGAFTAVAASPNVTATWSPLNLEPPPVPLIDSAAMFDVNGDGYADSLVIWYDRSIMVQDSTPDSIMIVWPINSNDTIVVRGAGEIFPNVVDNGFGNIFVLKRNFATQPLTGAVGEVKSASTFVKDGRVFNLDINGTILDRMAPIVAEATIKIAGKKGSGIVFDTLTIRFTEAVDTTLLSGVQPFEYMLMSESSLAPQQVLPFVTLWSADMQSAELRFRPDDPHPRMGDSVRIFVNATGNTLQDKRGNLALVSNPFVIIEGAKRSETQKITLTEMDPGTIADRWQGQEPTFIAPVGMYEDFATSKEKLTTEYGSILGHLVKIDMKTILSDSAVIQKYKLKKGFDAVFDTSAIKLVIKTQYYTSLGAYVAHSDRIISCADAVYGGDCRGVGNANIFVGWNLRSQDERVVGSGAYVAKLHAYITIDGLGKLESTEIEDRSIWGVIRKSGATGIIKK